MIEFEGSGQEHYLIFFRSNKFNVLKALEQLKGYLRMKQAEPSWYTGLGDVDNLGHTLELVGVDLSICPCQFKSESENIILVMVSSLRALLCHRLFLDNVISKKTRSQ